MLTQSFKLLFLIVIVFIFQTTHSQNIDFENIGRGKPFKVSGNITANTVYYNSNQNSSRTPFTYFIQGGLNFNIYEFSIPVTYSYSNQGEDLEYQLPFNFNRLSLHPKYRWIQAHIGDVNMNFSPYTLAGHQFTGGGIELTPKGGITFSAMYGRLLKAIEDNEDDKTHPSFKRIGYGAKIGYAKDKYSVGLIGFYAKDILNSLEVVPENKKVLPKENLVVSINASVNLIEGLKLKGEYASTAITQDVRAQKSNFGSGLASMFFNNRVSTEFYKAYKTELEYSFDKYRFGVGYERIDPGYETLGAYYFNNDFENITLNGNTTLFSNKLNLSFNIGYQKDDLNNEKDTKTNRTVGSINATYTYNKRINITGSYSNFSTYTNNKLNQFDVINDDNLLDNETERYNYKQLSQNANVNVNYILQNSKNKRQNLNVNYSIATVANAENGVVRIGNGSTFHNLNGAYTLGFPKRKLNITSAINSTYNTIGREDATTWGPTVSVNKKFLKDKLNTTFSSSYNTSSGTTKTSATNFRANANYIYREKHNFNLNAIQLFRNNVNRSTQDLTITFGYNYAFDLSVKKNKKNKRVDTFGFEYRTYVFEGEPYEISPEINAIAKLGKFSELKRIDSISTKLTILNQMMIDAELKSKRKYKKNAINYLRYLHKHQDFLDTYYELAFKSLKKLYTDAEKFSWKIEQKYDRAQDIFNNSYKRNNKLKRFLEKRKAAFLANKFMLEKLKGIKLESLKTNKLMIEFKNKNLSIVFNMLKAKKTEDEIYNFLILEFARMYHNKANSLKK